MSGIKINIVERLKEMAENADRTVETGLINEHTGSSMRMDSKGNVTVASSKLVQYKLHYAQGHATEISLESNTITNRKNMKADEIILNKHKFNPQMYELTDIKEYIGDGTSGIGNLTISGTVLVKAWEPNLKKWVLIRRSIRTPMFSNMLDIQGAPESMDINDNITDELEAMRKQGISFA